MKIKKKTLVKSLSIATSGILICLFLKILPNILYTVVIFGFAFLFSIGQREYSPEQAKNMYLKNPEIFKQVADICVRNEISCPIEGHKLKENTQNFSNEEKRILKQCIDIGCESIYYNIQSGNPEKSRVNFYIRSAGFTYQGIFIILEDVIKYIEDNYENTEEFISNNIGGEYNIKIEKLDENVYYYYSEYYDSENISSDINSNE